MQLEAGAIIAEPVWITTDKAGRYVVVDRSDRSIKVYEPTGALHATIGGPGVGPGEFTTLLGGGMVGDSIVGYDFTTTRVSIFDREGKFTRSVEIGAPGRALPLSVQPVDDSLLLALGVPAGNHHRDLLTLLDLDGRVRAQFFNRRDYFTPNAPDLVQSSVVVAAGGSGIIAASLLGADSLWIFDYSGDLLATGAIAIDGQRISSARELRAGNGGTMRQADGSSVLAGEPLLTSIAVLNSRTVLLQVMTFAFGKQPRLDRTKGGRYLQVQIDPAGHAIEIVSEQDRSGGLLGQTQGAALLLRYLDDVYHTVEIERLTTLMPRANRGG